MPRNLQLTHVGRKRALLRRRNGPEHRRPRRSGNDTSNFLTETHLHTTKVGVFVAQLLCGSTASTAHALTRVTTAAGIIIFNPSSQAGCYIKVTAIVSNCLRGHAAVCFSTTLIVNNDHSINDDAGPGDGLKASWLMVACWQCLYNSIRAHLRGSLWDAAAFDMCYHFQKIAQSRQPSDGPCRVTELRIKQACRKKVIGFSVGFCTNSNKNYGAV